MITYIKACIPSEAEIVVLPEVREDRQKWFECMQARSNKAHDDAIKILAAATGKSSCDKCLAKGVVWNNLIKLDKIPIAQLFRDTNVIVCRPVRICHHLL